MRPFDRLVGKWTSEATHPLVPGPLVCGSTTVEWLDGERFLIVRAHMEHPDFPDSHWVIGDFASDRVDETTGEPVRGNTGKLTLHHYDSRGVFRSFDASMNDGVWRLSTDAPGFSQRFIGTLSTDGNTIDGQWELRRDGDWKDDLKIVYRRSV